MFLKTLYVLFFIELHTRRVRAVGRQRSKGVPGPHPGPWPTTSPPRPAHLCGALWMKVKSAWTSRLLSFTMGRGCGLPRAKEQDPGLVPAAVLAPCGAGRCAPQ